MCVCIGVCVCAYVYVRLYVRLYVDVSVSKSMEPISLALIHAHTSFKRHPRMLHCSYSTFVCCCYSVNPRDQWMSLSVVKFEKAKYKEYANHMMRTAEEINVLGSF